MLLTYVPRVLRTVASLTFAMSFCAQASFADTNEAQNPTLNSVVDTLKQERALLSKIGTNTAKKIAGIGSESQLRIATSSRPNVKPVTSIAQVNAMPAATGGAEWACLTEALYFEARGESFKSIAAVAEVVINRRNSKKFPNTICAVISQGVGGRPGCQFSYKCDGHKEIYREPAARIKVGKIARLMLDGAITPVTHGALFYHNGTVNPRWARKFRRTASIGGHYFYKPS